MHTETMPSLKQQGLPGSDSLDPSTPYAAGYWSMAQASNPLPKLDGHPYNKHGHLRSAPLSAPGTFLTVESHTSLACTPACIASLHLSASRPRGFCKPTAQSAARAAPCIRPAGQTGQAPCVHPARAARSGREADSMHPSLPLAPPCPHLGGSTSAVGICISCIRRDGPRSSALTMFCRTAIWHSA